jgi:hypothetical protein
MIHKSEFLVPVTQQRNHHNNASHEVVSEQLESMVSGINDIFSIWAEKVTRNKHLNHLQLPRTEQSPVNTDENLL